MSESSRIASPEMSLSELRERATQVMEEVERRLRELELKDQRAAAMEERMKEQAARCEDRVRLNVGGQVFETHKSNLLRFEGSYFHGMLSGGQWRPDPTGCYFIDASPALFHFVMDALRGEPVLVDGLSRGETQRLRSLFDYFQLPCPDSLLSSAAPAPDTSSTLVSRKSHPGCRARPPAAPGNRVPVRPSAAVEALPPPVPPVYEELP